MQLKVIIFFQVLMSLWIILNGFIAGEMGWIYSICLLGIGSILLLGGCLYGMGRPSWRKLSIIGMMMLSLLSGSILIYSLYLIFQGDSAFGLLGLYPMGIFVYSVWMLSFYSRMSSDPIL